MNESDRFNAIIAEIEQQRNWALTRCAALSAELAKLSEKVKELEAKPDAGG